VNCNSQNVLKIIFLFQHIKEPTRFREGQSPTLDDLILTNEEAMIDNIEVGTPLGKSDHAVLTFDFLCAATLEIQAAKRLNYNKADFESMQHD
jgi:hypothetical protein